ncbi:MarR family winged helix-turn-helix transcriptional regulator [Pontibacter silvestris]|uniref:MarR family winged helix-turn-helix transcriptional regulator n=1 Tax=Pontibacter silvestris TaxID=2305183 RepID=A0ABW4X124_9BACT|nr:MarR family transcriptional regulator [Pontibacter silvestris]MCC9138257.1 MarR family transcriptional regulator [Pontibacter silvestris]
MNLENETGIKNFRNTWQKASISLIYTYGFLSNGYETFFKKYDITGQQYNALRILKGQYPKPISTSFLRENMLDKMSDASRLVSRLSSKELVDVSTNSYDKRLVNILLSNKGLELISVIEKEVFELDALMHGINEEEAEQLIEILTKVRKHLKSKNETESTKTNNNV